MKRGTIHHPKVAALARALSVTRYAAIGLLECLWHFTSQYAKAGDIGRFSDGEIADAVFWEDDAEKFVNALVETRWLDRVEQPCRLRVHDWAQHCDDAIHMSLARSGTLFTDGTCPSMSRLSATDKRRIKKKLEQTERQTHGVHTPDAQNTHRPAQPTQAQPSPAIAIAQAQPSPSQAPSPTATSGVGGNWDAARGGMGSGGLGRELRRAVNRVKVSDEPMLEVQAALSRAGVGAAVQKELMGRHDITPELIEHELRDIRAATKVSDVAGLLVHRLRGHQPGRLAG